MKIGETKLVANVLGWEWDGHVGMDIEFQENETSEKYKRSYNLKSSKGDFRIESLQLDGRIIEAEKF